VHIGQVFDDTTQRREIAAVNNAARLIKTQRITAQLVARGQI
jgi:DNA-binding CsgD family transcriptional regulator